MTITSPAQQAEPTPIPAETAPRLTIDVWADVLCPWCYLAEPRLARAIEQSPHAGAIDLRIHTYELDAHAPAEVTPILDYLAGRYRTSAAQARAMEERMRREAQSEGLPYEIDRPARNTLDMLRLIQLANEHGAGWALLRAMQDRVFAGHWDAFEHDTLARLAAQLGVPEAEARDVLRTDRYTDAVHADHAAALRLGATGVPFTVLGDRLGIPGAVGVEGYAAAIEQVWSDLHG